MITGWGSGIVFPSRGFNVVVNNTQSGNSVTQPPQANPCHNVIHVTATHTHQAETDEWITAI